MYDDWEKRTPDDQREKQLLKCGLVPLGISKTFSWDMQGQNHFYSNIETLFTLFTLMPSQAREHFPDAT